MPFVIRILHHIGSDSYGVGGGRTLSGYANYISEFKPEYMGGRGLLSTTIDAHEAKAFTTFEEAVAYWEQTHGIRSDGQPNRPLTAYTVAVVDQEAAAAEDKEAVSRYRRGYSHIFRD